MGFGMFLSFSFSRHTAIMINNGKTFEGNFDYFYTDRRLKICAGNTSCITEFQPVRFPSKMRIYNFLYTLLKYRLCCILSGTFVLFTAGVLDSFDLMALVIALTDSPIIHFIFQKRYYQKFIFYLASVDDEQDLFHYVVSSGDFRITVAVFGIDTTNHCGPFSNVDFVHYVLDNFLCFSYKKYAIAFLPSSKPNKSKLMCLKYYRAESDGWKDSANCDDSIERHMDVLRPYHPCSLPAECSCNLGTLQLLSVLDFTRHTLFNFTFHIDRFTLTVEKTYQQYVHAVRIE